MEFLPENSQFGIKTELEYALERDFAGLEQLVRQEIDDGALSVIRLSDEEGNIVMDFYEALYEEPSELDEEAYEVAERAVRLAKLLYAKVLGVELPLLFEPTEAQEDERDCYQDMDVDEEEDEFGRFISGVYQQIDAFDAASPATTDLIHRLNTELDFSGEYSGFAVCVAKLSCIAIEHTNLLKNFHERSSCQSFDNELALWLDEAS